MRYRILPAAEWSKLEFIIDPAHIPHSATATAAVAEDDDGNILGVLFLQLALHMEPLVLKTPKVSFARLHATLMSAIEQDHGAHFYAFSDKEIIDRMVEHIGMKRTAFAVYEGEVN
jgi:hypothetical protein